MGRREEPTREVVEVDRDVAEVDEEGRTLELREERLRARKELQEVGEVRVRREVEEVPGRLEVEAFREEVEVEHVPVGRVVDRRQDPWEEEGVLVVPIYEEQLVVSKRLVMREQIRVRRVGTTEKQLFEDKLLKERAVVEDPENTGRVHEVFATDHDEARPADRDDARSAEGGTGDQEEGGLMQRAVRKLLE
jgi:uncharacterized protein (TIGR02271 family)